MSQRGVRWPLIGALAALHALVIVAVALDSATSRGSKRPESIPVHIVPDAPRPPPEVLPKPLPAKRVAPRPVVEPPPVVVAELPREIVVPTITLPPDPPKVTLPTPPMNAPVTAVAAAPAIAPIVPPRFDAAYLDNPAPGYPSLSRRLHEEGRVLLRVLVGADGRAESVDVAASSGFERLDHAALEAVRRWRFVPARRGDSAVAAYVNVPVAFSLDRT